MTNLRRILERNRLQQTAAAEALGVSRIAVGLWVNGHSKPSGENLIRRLEYLRRFEPGLEASDLLDVTETAPEPQEAA